MLSKEEIGQDNAFKISMPLITDEDIRRIDNNFETIVKEFTKSYAKEKDLILAQYVMQKQQDKIDYLESREQKLIEKLEEDTNKPIPLAEDMDWIRCRKEYAKEILEILK